jgi:hypothetical protein
MTGENRKQNVSKKAKKNYNMNSRSEQNKELTPRGHGNVYLFGKMQETNEVAVSGRKNAHMKVV